MTRPLLKTATLFEERPHTFVGEASDLGLRPGEWPSTFDVPPDFGNGRVLILDRIHRDAEGDVTFALYRQQFGCISLQVFND